MHDRRAIRRSFPRGPLCIGARPVSAFAAGAARTSPRPVLGRRRWPPSRARRCRARDRCASRTGPTARSPSRDAGDTARRSTSSRPAPTASSAACCAGSPRDRRQRGLGDELPFRLSRWSDGRLPLQDPRHRPRDRARRLRRHQQGGLRWRLLTAAPDDASDERRPSTWLTGGRPSRCPARSISSTASTACTPMSISDGDRASARATRCWCTARRPACPTASAVASPAAPR